MPNTALRFTVSHDAFAPRPRQTTWQRDRKHGRVTSDLDKQGVPSWAWWMTLAFLAPFLASLIGWSGQ